MSLIVVDFETFYSKEYRLARNGKGLTTEEYIRHELFEVILVAVKVDDTPTVWFSGNMQDTKNWLRQFNWAEALLVCHNTPFDGLILSHHFGIYPAVYGDTLSMARPIYGLTERLGLANVARLCGAGDKGYEVLRVEGMRRADFDVEGLERYAVYCVQDVDLTEKIFHELVKQLPNKEMRLIDLTLRMYCQPVLELDKELLEEHLTEVRGKKVKLLASVGVDKKELMSNPKFAAVLESLGVAVPQKISPATGRLTYAFAKTDEGFKQLQEHENPMVQALVAARLGTRSTIEETRAVRFLSAQTRGRFPFSVSYCGAFVTHRWSGFDVNPQNMPRGGKLRKSILAPKGYKLVVGDLSAIELRVGLWLAGEHGRLELFRQGLDLYKKSAEEIEGTPYDQIAKDSDLRFVFKTINLSAIYGVGPNKMQKTLKAGSGGWKGVDKPLQEVMNIVYAYRDRHPNLVATWKKGEQVLKNIAGGVLSTYGENDVITVLGKNGLVKPSQMILQFPDLEHVQIAHTGEKAWIYKKREGARIIHEKTYGAKVFQRCVQSLARDIIGEHMLAVDKYYPVVGTVHDEMICLAPEDEAEECGRIMTQCMKVPPKWAPDLPLDCEIKIGVRYEK